MVWRRSCRVGNRKLAVGTVAYQCEEEIYRMLDSTTGFFPVIVSYGKWRDFIGEDRRDLTPEIIDSFSNTVWVDSTGLSEPQARNQYMVQAGKFGCDCIIILDTDEYLEFPLGIDFFKRQLERIADKNPDDLSFCVTWEDSKNGTTFTPRIIMNPMFSRYRDRHNQIYFMDKEVLGNQRLVGGIVIHQDKKFRSKNRELRMRERNLRNPIH